MPERRKRKRRKRESNGYSPKKQIFEERSTKLETKNLVEPEKKKPKLCSNSDMMEMEIELSQKSEALAKRSYPQFSHRSETLEKMLKLR
jgi:hypothetical protein